MHTGAGARMWRPEVNLQGPSSGAVQLVFFFLQTGPVIGLILVH